MVMCQSNIALLLYAVLGLAICGCTKSEPVSSSSVAPVSEAAQLKVYYFHRTIRCPSCEKIEALAQKAVEEGFAGQLADGKMQWRVINIDDPQNKHFEDDYRLQAQSVVLSEMRAGKETRWKNLEKVWDLLDDDAGFVRYVQDEIRAMSKDIEATAP
jgi:hypothetical protein